MCVSAGRSPILQPKFSDLHTQSCALATASAQNTKISLQLISLVLGARPRCPDLQQHTFVRALDKPSSQVLGTDLTVSGKETNRLVLTKPTKPSFSCYKLMSTDLTVAVHHGQSMGSDLTVSAQKNKISRSFVRPRWKYHIASSSGAITSPILPQEPFNQSFLTCTTHSGALATAY